VNFIPLLNVSTGLSNEPCSTAAIVPRIGPPCTSSTPTNDAPAYLVIFMTLAFLLRRPCVVLAACAMEVEQRETFAVCSRTSIARSWSRRRAVFSIRASRR
jgi:hypothetical protein